MKKLYLLVVCSLIILPVLSVSAIQVKAVPTEDPTTSPTITPEPTETPEPTIEPEIEVFPLPAGSTPLFMITQGFANQPITVSGKTVNYLTRQFGKGVLLINSFKTGLIADSIYGKPLAGFVNAEMRVEESQSATYHTLVLPDLKGVYYITPAVYDIAGNLILGSEFQVSL